MPAPKGNQFALGNKGTEKKFSNPDELQILIDEYFNDCDNRPIEQQNWVGKDGTAVTKSIQRPYTIEGLCLHLKTNRQTLLNYQKEDGYEVYFDIISRAKAKIAQQWIELGLVNEFNQRLVQFLLSNNSEYKEKKEVEFGEETIKAILINERGKGI